MEMITYEYRDAFANYYYTTGGSSPCTYSSTQVTQQPKFKDLVSKNGYILKAKKYDGV